MSCLSYGRSPQRSAGDVSIVTCFATAVGEHALRKTVAWERIGPLDELGWQLGGAGCARTRLCDHYSAAGWYMAMGTTLWAVEGTRAEREDGPWDSTAQRGRAAVGVCTQHEGCSQGI